ncbi:MAG: hypothetical protein CSB02_00305 [Bacteroidia bacterium]|nr:MAG: hypothetical protein CSB02_00305 [Bacteroidia bacterium]
MFKTNVSRVFIKPKPATVYEVKTITQYDVTDLTKWHYFSFEKGFIGESTIWPAPGNDSIWKERTDWDIAFHKNNVKTNSGVSGNGQVGVIKLDTHDFESITKVPQGDWVTDIQDSVMVNNQGGHTFALSTVNPELNAWAGFNHDEMAWLLAKRNVFIIKTVDGKYAKLQFLNILNDEDASGYMTLQYVYAKDGGTDF